MNNLKVVRMIVVLGQENYVIRIKKYLMTLMYDEKFKCYSIHLNTENPVEIFIDWDNIVLFLRDISRTTLIYVAFSQEFHVVVRENLENMGFYNVIFYDAELDNKLKRAFFKKFFAQNCKDFYLIDEEKSISVYMAKSIVDKPLKSYPKVLSTHITPIQVGAALTDERIADITDATGDNISERNRHFSETTALYWMWKNAEADYLGLCHYRRLWKDLDFIADKLQNDIIDVVLPVPTLCVHSVYEDYMERYIPKVYPTMLDVLREMFPDYYEVSDEIYRGHVFYACNMLIAKRRVLHELCQWMFPMVFEIERRIGDLPDPYQNRYAGFCTERLITLYFLHNKENWKITHADKIFIE